MKKEEDRIISITACHIESGEEIEFYGRLFADCTGDGTIGYLAGADYRMGRESRSEYGETIAPEIADSLVTVSYTHLDVYKRQAEVCRTRYFMGNNRKLGYRFRC